MLIPLYPTASCGQNPNTGSSGTHAPSPYPARLLPRHHWIYRSPSLAAWFLITVPKRKPACSEELQSLGANALRGDKWLLSTSVGPKAQFTPQRTCSIPHVLPFLSPTAHQQQSKEAAPNTHTHIYRGAPEQPYRNCGVPRGRTSLPPFLAGGPTHTETVLEPCLRHAAAAPGFGCRAS